MLLLNQRACAGPHSAAARTGQHGNLGTDFQIRSLVTSQCEPRHRVCSNDQHGQVILTSAYIENWSKFRSCVALLDQRYGEDIAK